MTKTLLIGFSIFATSLTFAQQQIGNGDMESWETVAAGSEPVNWSSFMTASGSLNGQADVQVEQITTNLRPGTTGTSCAHIWTRDAGFGIKANGNMTLGRVNMGSISPSGSSNYNYSDVADAAFSEAITDSPDSLVFWAKYNAANANSTARVKATLHDNGNYRDPEDAAATALVHGTAELNYAPTNGWVRISIPFNYSGAASTHTHLLITFASNSTPGGGDVNDEVFIDDVELIYNPITSGINEGSIDVMNVKAYNKQLHFNDANDANASYAVYSLTGALIQEGNVKNSIEFNKPNGVYLVTVKSSKGISTHRVYAH